MQINIILNNQSGTKGKPYLLTCRFNGRLVYTGAFARKGTASKYATEHFPGIDVTDECQQKDEKRSAAQEALKFYESF